MVQGNKSSANGMYLRKEKFRSNLRKRFLTVKVMEYLPEGRDTRHIPGDF